MSLGYVVSCDIRKIGENHGMRIIVQSQYPLTVVYSTIENAISSLDDFLSTMSVETFERNRSALLTNKRETTFRRMRDVGNLLWMEIVESTYNFRRTYEEMMQIEKISFQEIVDFYNEKIALAGPGNNCRIPQINMSK
jgi:secreted Zn-dependent insulinase-like peptidase